MIKLVANSDVDGARDKYQRLSMSGYVLYINSASIIWTSRLQTATTTSTSVTKFSALLTCVRDVRWTRDILFDMGCLQKDPTILYQDNFGAIRCTE